MNLSADALIGHGLSVVVELGDLEVEVVNDLVELLAHVVFPLEGGNHVHALVGNNIEGSEV